MDIGRAGGGRALVLVVGLVLAGADVSTQTVPEPPSVAAIEARLAEIDASTDLDAAMQAALRETYRATLAELESAARWRASALELSGRASAVPAALAEAEATPETPDDDADVSTLTLEEAEQRLAERQRELEVATSQLVEYDAEPLRRVTRRQEIRQLLVQLQERTRQIEGELVAPAPTEQTPRQDAARRTLLAARRMNVINQIASLEQELRTFDAEAPLIPAQRNRAARDATRLQQALSALQQQISTQRREDVFRQADAAREAAQGDYARALAALVERNTGLANRRLALLDETEEVEARRAAATDTATALAERFARTRDRVGAIGQIPAVGLLLRNQRESLPDLRRYERRVATTETETRLVQAELFDLDERRSQLTDLDTAVTEILREMGFFVAEPDEAAEEQNAARDTVRSVLETQRGYIDLLLADLSRYFDLLVETGIAEHRIIDETMAFRAYIDERILWTRSADPIGIADLAPARAATLWLVGRDQWRPVRNAIVNDVTSFPFVYAVLLVGLSTTLYQRRRLRQLLAKAGTAAARPTTTRYAPTTSAFVITTLMAAAGPALVWIVAQRLGALGENPFVIAVAGGLTATAVTGGVLEFLRQMSRTAGLLDVHFGWPARPIRLLRRELRWLLVGLLPLVFVATVMMSQDASGPHDALGRLALIGLYGLIAFGLHRLLHPQRGLLQEQLATYPDGWLSRLRLLWYGAAIAMPLLLAGVAAAGYVYTAGQLVMRVFTSLWLIVGVTTMYGLMRRWVLVSRRKLAFRQRLERVQLKAAGGGPDPGASHIDERPADLALMDTQTRQLILAVNAVAACAGMWLIWSDMVPAMRVLDRVTLWTLSGTEPGTTLPFTLEDLTLTLIFTAVTAVVARNVPAFLEMSLLQRLPLQAGVRYAMTTMIRYLLGLVGILIIAGVLGMTWSSVQWLVAALGVGLGFGLQEIFANFVSGIILLFERPVRVGDTVTIGATTGTITRIRMRATTILDWDLKELVVPNKDLVTGHLVNWTLTDSSNRVTISVGIAYGSDTVRVNDLLHEIVDANRLVLKIPLPLITFERFGDSALIFTMRLYLSRLEDRLPAIHDLHTTIARRFADEGIEIAFPQLDLHVRTPAARAAGMEALGTTGRPGPVPFDRPAADAPPAGREDAARGGGDATGLRGQR